MARYEVSLSYACNLVHRMGWPVRVEAGPIRFGITPAPPNQVPFLWQPPGMDR